VGVVIVCCVLLCRAVSCSVMCVVLQQIVLIAAGYVDRGGMGRVGVVGSRRKVGG
jgi:hypothetical protein